MEINKTIGNDRRIASDYTNMGAVFQQQRLYARAFEYLENAASMDSLFTHLQHDPSGRKRICLPSSEGLTFIFADEITRGKADVNYSHIFLKNNQKFSMSKTLKEFEEQVHNHGFCRVHNSHLVNLEMVKHFRKGKSGTLVLMDGTGIEVSTRRKENLIRSLKGF